MGKGIFTVKNLIKLAAVIAVYLIIMTVMEGNFATRHFKSLLVPIGINIILAVSLNITTGFLGELSLGHAGFMAIGAYSGALFTIFAENHTGIPNSLAFLIGIIIGGIVAALFGVVIGIPVLRLKGDYLAIVTLAFGEIVRSIVNFLSVTGGARGLSGIPRYTNYKWTYAFVIITIVLLANFVKSRYGRVISSIRDNSIAAESIGIKVSNYKIMAFVIAAFFAGVAGVLFGHNLSILKPGNFDYNKSIEILVIVVLGGMGSIPGSVISAIILTLLPEFLRGASNYRMLLYSLALILIMLFNSSEIRQRLEDSGKFPKLPKLPKLKARAR
ncbi:branched-chain amino acid ABC transporter permease [Anaerocolumna xylanovorans]|uniref:Branched-chain amino acid transport system permease protein n=1 Tax=Anaerocolumna xylanovorans DSM 12503 TaxID=1121345 RepID=A0A1M7YHN5_9FIRM|nr:branched-chain amino acid ABC transporter permease [Anaerocolumna xylanovorans]SHO52140.1 branched-chain amino acid transport system permease protein [Anaerocolumna xylanovorans DSM 12503]